MADQMNRVYKVLTETDVTAAYAVSVNVYNRFFLHRFTPAELQVLGANDQFQFLAVDLDSPDNTQYNITFRRHRRPHNRYAYRLRGGWMQYVRDQDLFAGTTVRLGWRTEEEVRLLTLMVVPPLVAPRLLIGLVSKVRQKDFRRRRRRRSQTTGNTLLSLIETY